MIVDASHREITQVYPVKVYHKLAQNCIEALEAIDGITSLILCGSLVKSDLVPGWSDIDLIIFVAHSPDIMRVLNSIRKTLLETKGTIQIGLGVDIVYEEEFKNNYKLGGRPLAMSYDTAAYGKVCFGQNPFGILPYGKTIQKRIILERSIGISAEIHNWRRAFLNHGSSNNDFVRWASRCIKTTLKLLKYEAGPSTQAPFTYQVSLDNLRSLNPSHSAIASFEQAVRLRKNWLRCLEDLHTMRKDISSICTTLANYPILSKMRWGWRKN